MASVSVSTRTQPVPRTVRGESLLRQIGRPLASLKLTVILFALAIVLVLVGTLSQVEQDIWEVLEDYFTPWISWIDVSVFFPRSWFPLLESPQAVYIFSLTTTLATVVVAALAFFNGNSAQPRTRNLLTASLLVGGGALALSSKLWGGFYFPGGAAIGAAMFVNLLSAHLLRFRVQTHGRRFWAGLAVLAVGALITLLVILSGHNQEGFQGDPPFAWTTLWFWVKVATSVAVLGMLLYGVLVSAATTVQRIVRWGSVAGGVLGVALCGWLWATGSTTYLGDSAMRVLWQLIQGSVAGLVLLAGAVLIFRKRAGVVVLHAGVGLMMFGQWFVSNYDTEEQITMAEGQTINYAQDIRSVELAVIDHENPKFPGQDDVVVVPLSRYGKPTHFLKQESVQDPTLPFDVTVKAYYKNSRIELAEEKDKNLANRGRGQTFRAVEVRGASGASGSDVNLAAAYLQFTSKTGEDLGTYLLSQDALQMRDGRVINFDTEQVEVDGKAYDVQLRFERNYKDYALQLLDVRKDDYLGTNTPRNYSSEVHLRDEQRGVNRVTKIWMNNPLRYAGETFYQSGWHMEPGGTEYTTLQVVRNHGWMIPYVACMISAVGLLAHFSGILLRFLNRRTTGAAALSAEMEDPLDRDGGLDEAATPRGWTSWGVPALVLTFVAVLLAWVAIPPEDEANQLKVHDFGKLPVIYQGRVKPFDTLARNSLRVISDKETFVGILPGPELQREWPNIEPKLIEQWPALQGQDLKPFARGDIDGLVTTIAKATGEDEKAIRKEVEPHVSKRQPAIRWLLDLISGSPRARQHKVIRIENLEVLETLGLERRKGYRYSLEELAPQMAEFERQVRQADQLRKDDVQKLSFYQRKLIEVDRKLRLVLLLHTSFTPPQMPPLPTAQEFQADHTAAMQKMAAFRQFLGQQRQMFEQMQPPLAIPPEKQGDPWQVYAAAWPMQFVTTQLLGQDPTPAFGPFNELLVAYSQENVKAFNNALNQYEHVLRRQMPDELHTPETFSGTLIKDLFGPFYHFEWYFNHWSPFFWCLALYLVAFVLLCVGWLGWSGPLNRAALTIILVTFVLHTLALAARVYISGRPPVTNLYSSAVFIGWGIVLLTIVIELIYRNGLASVVGAISGFATLLIAYKLAGDGDTFEVLQAVLDTQFWLATHVVCITLGYSTTFLAGMLGILYVLRGFATSSLSPNISRELARMIYGTLCFAIFFSFIGTVLGGLWADDSWGRFWGWDPKENGALIIVLWNALILHARWDGIVKERGLAVLAICGNVVTAWSWFGVNELGIGLHSYGFTEGRLQTLGLVVLAHLGIILVGALPRSLWWSFRRIEPVA